MPDSLLIVDDDPDEANLVKRAVLSLHPKSPVTTLLSGRELQNYLNGEGAYADREAFPYPAAILLDLRMPQLNGFELMEWLRSEPRHQLVPVIVISSYDRQKDIRKSYQLGARTFLSKPVSAKSIRAALRSLMVPVEFCD